MRWTIVQNAERHLIPALIMKRYVMSVRVVMIAAAHNGMSK